MTSEAVKPHHNTFIDHPAEHPFWFDFAPAWLYGAIQFSVRVSETATGMGGPDQWSPGIR